MRKESKYTTNTEIAIRDTVTNYRCIAKNQLPALMPYREGITEENIEYAINRLLRSKQIFEDGDYYRATLFDECDIALIDSIWIMIEHLGSIHPEDANASPTVCAKFDRPLKLCYLKDENIYYVAFIRNVQEIMSLSVINERLRAKGNETEKSVRIVVASYDTSIAERVPKMSFPTLVLVVNHPTGNIADKPELSYSK